MRIISPARLSEFYQKHADAKIGLKLWEARMREANITNLHDLKKLYNSADIIGNNRVIFDIKGNHYRLITVVLIRTQTVYIRWVGTHAEYDKVNAHTV